MSKAKERWDIYLATSIATFLIDPYRIQALKLQLCHQWLFIFFLKFHKKTIPVQQVASYWEKFNVFMDK